MADETKKNLPENDQNLTPDQREAHRRERLQKDQSSKKDDENK